MKLKMNIFLSFINNSIDIVHENKNGQIYLKIVELCTNTTKVINNYLV